MHKNLKAGAAVSYLYIATHVISNFLYAPILLAAVGDAEYGLYQLIGSLYSYIAVFESSMSAGILKYYCEAKNSGNAQRQAETLAVGRRMYRVLSGITAAAGCASILLFRLFYQSSFTGYELQSGSIMLALLFVNLIAVMENGIYLAGLQADEEFVFIKALSILQEVLQPCVCWILLKRYPHAVTAVAVQLGLSLFVILIRWLYADKKLGIRPAAKYRNKTMERAVLAFSGGILAAQIADQIFWKADQLILGKYYGTAVVAVYAIGSQIYTNYMYTATPVASVFFPRLSRMAGGQNGPKQMSDLFIKVGRIAFTLSWLVLTAFLLIGRDFIRLWVGNGFEEAYVVALIVMIPFTIDIIQNLGLSILQVTNQYGFRAKMYLTAALLNVVSTAVMAKFWGMYGAALSTGITMLLTSGFIMNWFYQTKAGLNIQSFWKNIGSIALKTSPVFLTGVLIRSAVGSLSAGAFLLFAIGYTAAYGLWMYAFAADEYEKQLMQKAVRKVLRKGEKS